MNDDGGLPTTYITVNQKSVVSTHVTRASSLRGGSDFHSGGKDLQAHCIHVQHEGTLLEALQHQLCQ